MMNRIRNIKNRLSLSVDKVAPVARERSPPSVESPGVDDDGIPSSAPVSSTARVVSGSPTPKRPKRDKRSTSRQRPSSVTAEPSGGGWVSDPQQEDIPFMDDRSLSDSTAEDLPRQEEKLQEKRDHPSNLSLDAFRDLSKSLTSNEPESLMEEVMKEVDKISSSITGNVSKLPGNGSSSVVESNPMKSSGNERDKSPCSLTESASQSTSTTTGGSKDPRDTSDDALNTDTAASSSNSLVQERSRPPRPSDRRPIGSGGAFTAPGSSASALHAESLTSGYFSDSEDTTGTSESKERLARAKTASPIHRMFRLSKATDKTDKKAGSPTAVADEKEIVPSKKESIYSRLIKSTKRDSSVSRSTTKEPIYARIKPKLKIETSFKPIEPIVSKESSKVSDLLVKPEPIYSKFRSKKPSSPKLELQTPSPVASIFSGGPSSSFTPVTPVPLEKEPTKEPIYSCIKPKKEKTRTLPLESLYSRIRKKDVNTLPKESLPKNKEPIYNQPLPALPDESRTGFSRYDFLNSSSTSSYSTYGRVVAVTAKETSVVSPSKPSVITISNPGYAKTFSPSTSPPVSPTTKGPESPLSSSPEAISKEIVITPVSHDHSPVEDVHSAMEESIQSLGPGSKETLDLSHSTLGFEDEIKMDLGSSSKLSRLVEELAQELETVSQRKGDSIESKREVLTRLLSTYDVPRNLRRVEEADEDDIRRAEKSLLRSSSGDELRYVDDDEENMETVYADVPDYSHDEFVIALDDENDPKYASLTRGMRRKPRGGESPGKVSRKSAQVYVNVVNVISALKVLINSNSTKAATVINRMGTLARPYASKVHTSISDNNTWIQRRLFYQRSGHNGFDELRKYIKSGGEFCKELAIIMHERAELEATYAKGLHKLSSKLVKASRDSIGTISEAWQAVGAELEHEGDVHRILAASLTEDVVRPLRQVIETQHKIRKGVEGMVDKATKNMHDWKAAETKAKKNCYHNTRENEKVQDMMLESRLGRGKALSDKETVKLEKQRRKAEEAVQKSDVEYYNYCVRTERARQEWESAVYKGSNCFQTLEEDRLASLKDLILKYHKTNKEAAPKLVAVAARLDEPVALCDVEKDIQSVIIAKGTGENVPEQYLPDFYSEDFNNVMNKVRRREALEKFVKLIRTDLERERRGKQGVENLAKALQETPNFGGEESQQDVNDKLQNMKAMLAYLEAARFKVQSSLDEVNSRPRPSHPLAKHIETHRDKQGFPVSVLKVPPWVRGNSTDVSPLESPTSGSPNWNDRGAADGTSVQPDSDFDPLSIACAPINPATVAVALTEDNPIDINDSVPPSVEATRGDVATSSSVAPLAFMYPARYPSLILPTDEFSSQGSDHPDYQSAVNDIDATTTGGGGGGGGGGSIHRQVMESRNGILHTSNEQLRNSGAGTGSPDGTYYARPVPPSGGQWSRCKALYDYEANLYDELSIRTGDIINIHEKQPDGWWVGEIDGNAGIFPATYVEEID